MDTQVITIANNKGGVGKTSLAINVGAYLARRGYRTLLIDMDAQSSLTDIYLEPDTQEIYIVDALKGEASLPIVPISKNLHIVPSNHESNTLTLGDAFMLTRAIAPVRAQYDMILVDTPPNMNILTINALCAARWLIIPITAELLPLKGMREFLRSVEDIKQINTSLELAGVVVCRYERRRINRMVEEELLDTFGDNLLTSRIRSNVSIIEAPLEKTDIHSYDSHSAGSHDYKELAKEIINKITQS